MGRLDYNGLVIKPNATTTIQSPSRGERWALLGLFLLVLLPRLVYPASRPLQWHDRSIRFVEAVGQGNLDDTLYSEHPGVTVMWLSGLSQWGYYGLREVLGQQPPHPADTGGRAYTDQVAVALLPLALLIAVGVVWSWHLLARLADRRVAWMAALLWALDPFFMANSKVVHLDPLLSTLMWLSALYMLLYLRRRARRALLWSALLGGLALLTKTVALFLIPFFGLCLLLDWPWGLRSKPELAEGLRRWGRSLLAPLALWLLVALAVWVALWPAMWVRPGDVLELLYQRGFVRHAIGGRPLPLLYRGQVVFGDPGPRFYLDGVLFRTTFLTLPFALVGLLAGFGPRVGRSWFRSRERFLLAAYVVFFFTQMCLGSGKDVRYLLPLFMAVDVLAAVGLLWWAEGMVALVRSRARVGPPRRFASLLAVVLLLLQAVLVLPHFPYFGLHYNALLGGVDGVRPIFPLADFGEGLDLAGRYVDGLPEAASLRVGTQYLANEMLAQYMRADIYDVDAVEDNVDLLVFGTQYNARRTDFPRWGEMWEVYQFRQPERVFYLEGWPYAWVYRTGEAAQPPDKGTLDVRLGKAIRLVGYRLAPRRVVPGESLRLTLYWQATGPIEGDYTVFTHLVGPDGTLVAQQDNPPGRGARPTSGWEVGELIEDPYELALPADAPSGDYSLSVGMYDPLSGDRLAARAADGAALPENRVVLETVPIRPLVPGWRRGLALGWLALVGLGCLAALLGRTEAPE